MEESRDGVGALPVGHYAAGPEVCAFREQGPKWMWSSGKHRLAPMSMLGHDEVLPQAGCGGTRAGLVSLPWAGVSASRSRTWSGVIITPNVRVTLWFAAPLVLREIGT